MAIETVRNYLRKWGREDDIIELETSSATVELAAQAFGVEQARIAKTICLKAREGAVLIVAAGDARIDNGKFKAEFGLKPKMLTPDEVFAFTGYAVGGVCPFALKESVPVYLDIALKRFQTVFPACGSSNSGIKLTCEELFTYSQSKKWVDVCKGWQ